MRRIEDALDDSIGDVWDFNLDPIALKVGICFIFNLCIHFQNIYASICLLSTALFSHLKGKTSSFTVSLSPHMAEWKETLAKFSMNLKLIRGQIGMSLTILGIWSEKEAHCA